jgi:RNA recognition motif-containing protein
LRNELSLLVTGTYVYVADFSDGLKKEDSESAFEKYGKLRGVWVAFSPPGLAFIDFTSEDEAELACVNLNGSYLLGSKLRVKISQSQCGEGRSFQGN